MEKSNSNQKNFFLHKNKKCFLPSYDNKADSSSPKRFQRFYQKKKKIKKRNRENLHLVPLIVENYFVAFLQR